MMFGMSFDHIKRMGCLFRRKFDCTVWITCFSHVYDKECKKHFSNCFRHFSDLELIELHIKFGFCLSYHIVPVVPVLCVIFTFVV